MMVRKCECGGTYTRQDDIWISRKRCTKCNDYIDLGGKQMTKDKGRYIVHVECMNCRKRVDWAISKGKIVRDFLKGKVCTRCGCKFVVSRTTHFRVGLHYREYMSDR